MERVCRDRKKVGAANAGDIEGRPLKSAQQPLFDGIEEIDAFDGLAGHDARCGKAIERSGAGREIVEGGEEGQIPAISANQDLAKVGRAVDSPFDRGQVAGGRPLAMFHFAVVLEGGDVVGGGLQT
jgi:hypothetical protein